METNTELIVLNYIKYKDNSVILNCLSKDFGKCAFFVNTGRRNLSLFSPLNILEADVKSMFKSSGKLKTAHNFTQIISLIGIKSDIYKKSMCLFMSEILWKCMRDEYPDAFFYEWCKEQIITLDKTDKGCSNFHLYFLLNMCTVLGFKPAWNESSVFFEEVETELAKFTDISNLNVPLNGAIRNKMCNALIKYLSFHSGQNLNIKSLEILRTIYA